MKFVTKDSGERVDYPSGMRRDIASDKPRFDLINGLNFPYEESLLYRWAKLMQRGAEKYGENNWCKANSEEELDRFKASAWRHFIQAMSGEDDEDHFAAVCFNLNAILYLKWKVKEK